MTASECVQLFELHHRLLPFYEPQDAVLWLVSKHKLLDLRMPCEVLADKHGFIRLLRLISEIGDGSYS